MEFETRNTRRSPEDVKGVVEGLDVLQGRFASLMAEARKEYLPITVKKFGDKAVEAALEHFRDKEIRDKFYEFYRGLEEVYEILSPDAFLRPFLEDYRELTNIYLVCRANYDRGVPVDRSFLRKTAKLVQEHTKTGDVQDPDKVHKLTAEALEQIGGEDKPDAVKVFNLLKALDELGRQKGHEEPYLINICERAEQIAEAFEDRQKTTQETLRELEQLLKELREAEKQRAETELSPEAFAVYWLLRKDGIEKADEVAQAAAKAFEEHPHWQTSSHQEQEVRKSLYKALIDAGIEGVVEFAQKVMKMLRRGR